MTMLYAPLNNHRETKLGRFIPIADFGKVYNKLFSIREHVQVMAQRNPADDESSDCQPSKTQSLTVQTSRRGVSKAVSEHFASSMVYDVAMAYNTDDVRRRPVAKSESGPLASALDSESLTTDDRDSENVTVTAKTIHPEDVSFKFNLFLNEHHDGVNPI